MQKIVPNIWCNGDAEQAGEFYASAFEDASTEITSPYPESDLPDFQRDLAGEPLTVDVVISGTRLTLINAGGEFRPNPSISFMLRFDPQRFDGTDNGARAAIDRLWAGLSDGGRALMPLGEYPFSGYYGWIEDRYGGSWQLMLPAAGGASRPFISPALMFDGRAQNRAAEAADLYVSLFADGPGAELGARSPYGRPSGAATADALAFGEFRIGEQWFVVM